MSVQIVDTEAGDQHVLAETTPPPQPPSPTGPVPDDSPTLPASALQMVVTGLVVVAPLVALAVAIFRLWGHGVTLRDLLLALVLYLVSGFGVTIGYHRLLTHRSFVASRPLKVALTVAGSLAFQGGPIGWVGNHRVHHARSDRAGDPHSPVPRRPGLWGELGGLWHAHTGWLFRAGPEVAGKLVGDLRRDRDLTVVDRLFPVWCVLSLALPFAIGWAWGGTLGAGLTAFLWAGLVRVGVLHHVGWSVNSICHRFGRRPFPTQDRSRNVRFLALPSFGEAWHNGHHAFPRSARHGIERGQWDPSAVIIRAFERLGWAHDVHWPKPPGHRRPEVSPAPG
jgi:stearoyl-CoA desaturase (delta-9 desaturase)